MRSCVLLIAALASCGKDRANASEQPPPAKTAPSNVEVYVDDNAVASVSPAEVSTWPRLDTLVPVTARRLGTWDMVTLKGKTAKPSEVRRPSDTYPELVPALFPDEAGGASFGMFDPVELAKHGKPALREDAIREIRIKLAQGSGRGEHESGEGGGQDPSQIKVAIKTPKGESTLDGKTILAIPRQPMPGDDSKDAKGWQFRTLLDAAGIKSFERLLLTDAGGTNLTLDKADFSDKSIPYVKLNRSGQLRFKVYKQQGTAWQVSGDLRGIVSIEVVK